MNVPISTVKRIWSLPDESVPSVHVQKWYEMLPTSFRAVAVSVDSPVPVTERRVVPAVIAGKPPLQALMVTGEALLHAVSDPRLRLSLVGGRIVVAGGITILLVERRRDGEIVVCPWSSGETRKTVMKRLIALRKAPPVALTPADAYIARRLLPRPAAAVSVVSGFSIENPGTNILASGGECPISLTIGTKTLHFSLDHRLYDPADAACLYGRFFRALEKGQAEPSKLDGGENGSTAPPDKDML